MDIVAYATWQHDRSQDELGLMAAQDAQQRDPQGEFFLAYSILEKIVKEKLFTNYIYIYKYI